MNVHLFPLVLVEYGRPGDGFVRAKPDQERIEISPEHRVQLRWTPTTARLDLWVIEGPRDHETYVAEVHLTHARMTEFSETDVQFEGIKAGCPARVIFTNQHQGWQA